MRSALWQDRRPEQDEAKRDNAKRPLAHLNAPPASLLGSHRFMERATKFELATLTFPMWIAVSSDLAFTRYSW